MPGKMEDLQIRLAFMAILGMEPRMADYAILSHMGPTPEIVAEYIWDHMLGEPLEPTQDQILEVVQTAAINA